MNSTPEGLPVRLSTTAIPVGSAAAGDATATAPARARVTSQARPMVPAEKRANAKVVVAMTGLPLSIDWQRGFLACHLGTFLGWRCEVHHKERVAPAENRAARCWTSFRCRSSIIPAFQRHVAFSIIRSADATLRMGKIRSRSNAVNTHHRAWPLTRTAFSPRWRRYGRLTTAARDT